MEPRLLAEYVIEVGARNSNEHDSARRSLRPSGERGGGDDPIDGAIVPPLPPSHVPLIPPGLTGTDSKRLKEPEEAESCPSGSKEASPYGQDIVDYRSQRCNAAYGYCSRLVAQSADLDRWGASDKFNCVRLGTEHNCRVRGRPLFRGRGRGAAYMHRRLWSSPATGGGQGTCGSYLGHIDREAGPPVPSKSAF
jgi:hypothetical protein